MEKAEEQVVIKETEQIETTGFRIFVLKVGRYMEQEWKEASDRRRVFCLISLCVFVCADL